MLAFTATVLAYHLINKALRQEFETLAALERAPNRDCAVPGQHSSGFGSPQCRGIDRMLPTVDYALYNSDSAVAG
jgi:hypothetical protein